MINTHDDLIKVELSKMGVDAFAVLMVIAVHLGPGKKAWPGIGKIRKMTGLSRERAYKALAVLIAMGLIERRQENKGGVWGKIVYRVTCKYLSIYVGVSEFELEADQEEEEQPQEQAPELEAQEEEQAEETPHDGKPYDGKPYDGNPSHRSINKQEVLRRKEVLRNNNSLFNAHAHEETTEQVNPLQALKGLELRKAAREEILTWIKDTHEGQTFWKDTKDTYNYQGGPGPVFFEWVGNQPDYTLWNWKDFIHKIGSYVSVKAKADFRTAYKQQSKVEPTAPPPAPAALSSNREVKRSMPRN